MTESDRRKYSTMVEFLGQVLGPFYEVVFHVINDEESYVEKIVNGHISGRSKDASLTDFAISLIESKAYEQNDYKINYKGITKNKTNIQGSTFFIKNDEGRLEGMICINVDLRGPEEFSKNIFRLFNVDVEEKNIFNKDSESEAEEFFPDSVQDILYSVVDPKLLDERIQLKPQETETIISLLDDKYVFQIKGAVSKVAELLHISEPSVYRHLKNAKSKKNKK